LSRAVFAPLTTRAAWVGALLGAALTLAAHAASIRAQANGQLTLCHAGSLQSAFAQVEKAFAAEHPDVVVKRVSGGSVALAGRIAAGLQPCDVYAAADYNDIGLLLKPIGLADYTIVFAKGRMVLAYLATDPMTRGIAAAGEFNPPASVPNAAGDWYRVLLNPGVRLAGSHPFLDPAGYRAHMMLQLAQAFYNVPDLSHLLLEHYTILPNPGPAAAGQPALGKDYNFQFIYEHSAAAAVKNDSSYRYVALPDRIDLSTTSNDSYYRQATVTIPGIARGGINPPVSIPATRVAWGLTILTNTPNAANAIAFVKLMLGAAGTAALSDVGPAPISPAVVVSGDYSRLPRALQSLVTATKTQP
jgi:molybdate/tungstate transport system substrate-binding protein